MLTSHELKLYLPFVLCTLVHPHVYQEWEDNQRSSNAIMGIILDMLTQTFSLVVTICSANLYFRETLLEPDLWRGVAIALQLYRTR